MNVDLADIIKMRLDFCRELGIKIDDEQFFINTVQTYGYREIVSQYLDHFFNESQDKFKQNTTFREIYDYYRLDQSLKNEAMIDLQLFEQTFKAALTDVIELQDIHLKVKKAIAGKSDHVKLDDHLKEKYVMQTGRVIRRGELRSRIRRIKENYLEPFVGFNKIHSKITPWVLIKEMSFGVACNYFFLLHGKQQELILKQVFKDTLSTTDFEKIVDAMRAFRDRAAHNYSLLGVKDENGNFLYKTIYNQLLLLKNQEPANRIKNNFQKIEDNYLDDYPEEKAYLDKVLF